MAMVLALFNPELNVVNAAPNRVPLNKTHFRRVANENHFTIH
jgi:hypothetical protein